MNVCIMEYRYKQSIPSDGRVWTNQKKSFYSIKVEIEKARRIRSMFHAVKNVMLVNSEIMVTSSNHDYDSMEEFEPHPTDSPLYKQTN